MRLVRIWFCLVLSICCKQALSLSLADIFGQTKAVAQIYPIFTSEEVGTDLAEEEETSRQLTTLPAQPIGSFFTSPLFPFVNAQNNMPANAINGNTVAANSNNLGQGRFFGALFALRNIANNGLGGGGIVINTPLNLTNVNNNGLPTTITATTAGTVGTRLAPYPVPVYHDHRSANDAASMPAAGSSRIRFFPLAASRRRPFRRQSNKVHSPYRTVYLKK